MTHLDTIDNSAAAAAAAAAAEAASSVMLVTDRKARNIQRMFTVADNNIIHRPSLHANAFSLFIDYSS